MGRVFCTGDRHGDYAGLSLFCEGMETTKQDVLIVLGDNGANFFGDERDEKLKKQLDQFPITFVMVKGNHDMRPSTAGCGYELMDVSLGDTLTGSFWIQREHPSLLFAKEYGPYVILGKQAYAIGGAYSIDKDYRLEMQFLGNKNYKWFADEELSDDEMLIAGVEVRDLQPHYILSHTCPLSEEPYDRTDLNLPPECIRMEKWMDGFKDIPYRHWLCGHWHINRKIDRMHFLYDQIVRLTKGGHVLSCFDPDKDW